MRETILKDAASVYPISVSDFDCNPYLLNCLNGTLDLKTMTFRNHDSEDFLTMMTNVRYNPNARCQRWEQHIQEIMCDDAEMIAYLQKALGYALTGITAYEAFMILFGPTSRNGKGVTMSTYTNMIGDYGCTTNPETITQKMNTNSSAPSEDIARLAGKRFVNISEPDKNLVLSSALVKTLTGNDKITARFLHENSFEFYPKFKIFINTNYLPKVTDSTIFSSGRVKVLMFNRHFEPHEQDKGLKNELSKPENLSGILNWCIEGWQMLQATGFDEPQAVIDAVEAYREDSDKVGLFLKERMLADPNGEASMTDTYNEYRDWCYDNGYKVESMASFKKSLVGRATIKRKRLTGMGRSANPVSVICGYNLIAPVNVPLSCDNSPEGEQEPEGGI